MMTSLHQLVWPLWDALGQRSIHDGRFQNHARAFPQALSMAERDQKIAQAHGYLTDTHWRLHHVLSPALDRRDDWLCVMGRSHALVEETQIEGQWPQKPFIALGTHWGAGLPTLAHLASEGRKPLFVYRQEPDEVRGSVSERWAHQIHLKALKRLGGVIALGGAYQQIMRALERGATPVILMDAPSEGRPTLIGRDGDDVLRVREGLLAMLCRERLPFAFYRCGFDPQTHQRTLTIGPQSVESEPQVIADQAAHHLHEAMRLDPAQWRLWVAADALLA